MGPGGLLAVADGDRIKMVDLDDADRVVCVWAGPDADILEPFKAPVALAFGPNGDLAVAEGDGGRISFVRLAAFPERVSLPSVSR